jgi:hypothetical protein
MLIDVIDVMIKIKSRCYLRLIFLFEIMTVRGEPLGIQLHFP